MAWLHVACGWDGTTVRQGVTTSALSAGWREGWGCHMKAGSQSKEALIRCKHICGSVPMNAARVCISIRRSSSCWKLANLLKKTTKTKTEEARPRHEKGGSCRAPRSQQATCLLGTQVKKTKQKLMQYETNERQEEEHVEHRWMRYVVSALHVQRLSIFIHFFRCQVYDWQRQQPTSCVSAVRGAVAAGGEEKAPRSAGNTRLKQIEIIYVWSLHRLV